MLPTIFWILSIVVVLSAASFVVWRFRKFSGMRLVTCPEENQPAAVRLDAGRALITSFGGQSLRLSECTYWPQRQDCAQTCLKQIAAAPEDCLVRTILTRWYEGKTCAFCKREFGKIDWREHKPALVSSERVTIGWDEIRPERLPTMLNEYLPVCWNCHIASTFRREHPDMVTDREWKHH